MNAWSENNAKPHHLAVLLLNSLNCSSVVCERISALWLNTLSPELFSILVSSVANLEILQFVHFIYQQKSCFQMNFLKPKPKLNHPGHSQRTRTIQWTSQSKNKMRESVSDFFFPDWWQNGRRFLSQSPSVNAKPNQTLINFDNEVKTGPSKRGQNADTNNFHLFWDIRNYL